MAFSTYSDFKDAVASWLSRSDLTAQIPDFITLFEAAAARKLQVRSMETSTTLTPDANGEVSLPSDYLSFRRVTWVGSTRVELEYVHPSLLQAYYPVTVSSIPRIFTIEGSTLKVRPLDSTAIEFDYFAKNAAVSSSLNWLFTNYPDAYLFGTLYEAYMFQKDFDQAAPWMQRRDQVFDEISRQNFRSNAGMAIKVFGATP